MNFGYYMDQLYSRRITEIYTIEKGVTSISMLFDRSLIHKFHFLLLDTSLMTNISPLGLRTN